MKKEYSLALGWWSARWYAHIWVYKYLLENNIKIKEVAGTSIWAVIAAFIATWKTIEEIIKIIDEIKVIKLIDFDIYWNVKWDKVLKKLEEIFWETKIENCDIKLKIIASKLSTWEKKVFSKWKISNALRASISIPMIFAPYKQDWEYLVDWGICCNLPTEELSWENIIAVWVSNSPPFDLDEKFNFLWIEVPKNAIKTNFRLAHHIVDLMIKRNEQLSIQLSDNKNIIYIEPKIEKYWSSDFDKIEEITQIWYNTAKKELKNII